MTLDQNKQSVCVVGLGYIGLPTASLIATKGYQVHGVDVSPKVVEIINNGDVHIEEKDLDVLVRSAVNSGNLKASLQPVAADVFILAVPTPFKDGHKPDTSYVQAATESIAPMLKAGDLVILESTSPIGTTEQLAQWLDQLRPDLFQEGKSSVFIAHCPERVLPGRIIIELVENDRIIGGVDTDSAKKAKQFYSNFVCGQIFTTSARVAEMTKLVENSFRDVNIAFANELATICDELGMEVWEVIELANKHPRVNVLKPGPGVGGHCIAVDPWFIVDAAPEQAKLIRMAREINDDRPKRVVAKIKEQSSKIKNPVIACLGLAYKANIDDLRESPAMQIAADIAKQKLGKLMIVEPHIDQLPEQLTNVDAQLELVGLEQALKEANIVALLVDHQHFITVDKDQYQNKVIIDTRGLWR